MQPHLPSNDMREMGFLLGTKKVDRLISTSLFGPRNRKVSGFLLSGKKRLTRKVSHVVYGFGNTKDVYEHALGFDKLLDRVWCNPTVLGFELFVDEAQTGCVENELV